MVHNSLYSGAWGTALSHDSVMKEYETKEPLMIGGRMDVAHSSRITILPLFSN